MVTGRQTGSEPMCDAHWFRSNWTALDAGASPR